ncbi:beta strand repeat-containing protein [Paludisphaera borealis]|uniref:Calx-beta domain-containing protein n=1 Tax=Paludisphaera borealis TaxID=1387353 RepID=A0A1U7CRB4_9BACT|nr:Calx-beta domain-containing protein [Paludisphaera borealis]APW61472.1 putative beta-solenoid-type carbohydrate-active enzyme (GH, PL, or CE) of unknown function [Paludisphaera borealis]
MVNGYLGQRRKGLAARRRSSSRFNLEALERRELLAVWTVVSNTDTGTASTTDPSKGDLRYCLTQANTDTNPVIQFSIAGNTTIQLTGPLPAVAKPMLIDATTQGTFAGVPLVEIEGKQITAAQSALTITATAGGTTVKGLAFDGSAGTGITIQGNSAGGGDGNTIVGCFFGTSDGVASKPNLVGLKIFGSSNNTIGGTTQFASNLISGNTTAGLVIGDAGVANGNLVVGNIIGLDVTGKTSLAPQATGVLVDKSSGTQIQGNLISGNTGDGVWLNNVNGAPTAVTIVGNGVGVDTTLLAGVANVFNGIHVSGASGVTIGGTAGNSPNLISGNTLNGVLLDPSAGGAATTGVLIQGNRIGTDLNGAVAIPNNNDGVQTIGTQGVTIGGLTTAARNLISGNKQSGVELANITFGANTIATLIQGNWIGVNASGTNALPNAVGVNQNGGDATTIGGTAAGAGNLISGNTGQGVRMGTGDHSLVQGNLIGTNATGTAPLGNGTGLLFANASFATIGGAAAGAGNIISGNGGAGIDSFVIGSQAEVIQGNWIGVVPGATPTSPVNPLGNGGHGVQIWGPINVLIGGTGPGEGNIIAANGVGALGGNGINTFGETTGLVVEGNFIGTDRIGTPGLGNGNNGANGGNGVSLFSNGNTIGGTAPGAGNVIANNSSNGIALVLGSNNNSFLGNSIYNNGQKPVGFTQLGINFGQSNEPLVNQVWPPGPANSGPNNFQNYPVLDPSSGIYDNGSIEIKGTLNANVGQTYRVEFFASPTQNVSGFGEGKIFLGATAVAVTNTTTYTAAFDATLTTSAPIPSGYYITATATDALGNTSEFAKNIVSKQIVDVSIAGAVASNFPGDPTKVIVGGQLTYTLTITNSSPVAANTVSLVDTLDPNVVYQPLSSSTSVPGVVLSYNSAGGTVSAVFPTIAAGQTVTVTIVALVAPSAASGPPAPITNAFAITTADVNSSLNTSGEVDTTNALPAADLRISGFAASPDGVITPLYAGGGYSYSIGVANQAGLSDATNVVVTDYLPDSTLVTFDPTQNPGWTLHASGTSQYATYDVGTLVSGASQTLTLILGTTAAAVGPPLSSFATVFSTAVGPVGAVFDPNLANNTSATINTPVTAAADVQVTVVPDPSTVYAGDNLSYTINVINNGPSPSSGVILTNTVPAGTTFISAEQDGAPLVVTPVDGVLTFNLGGLNAGASIKPIVITVGTAGITSSAAVSPTTTANLAWTEFPNASSAADVVVGTVTPKSQLSVALQSDPSSIYVGGTATYTVTVANTGPSDDTNVTAVLVFPANTIVTLTPGTYTLQQTPTSQIVTFNLGSLAAGASVQRTIAFTALPAAADSSGSGTVNVSATVTGANYPANTYPPALAGTTVLAAINLSIQLSATPNLAQIGQNLVYTIQATNSGPSTATGVVVYNALPAIPQYVTFVSAKSNGVPINVAPNANGVLTLPVGTLTAGQSIVFTITVTTTNAAIAASPIFNTAQVVGAEHDTNPDDDQKTIGVTVTPAVDLTTTLTAAPSTVEVGDYLTYTTTVLNSGPSNATNLTLIATIPANSTFVSASPGVTVSNGRLILNISNLAVGGMVGFQYVVSPTSSALTTGTLVSLATAQTSEAIINPSTSQTSLTIPVIDRYGIIQLASASYTVNEDAGSVAIVVNRVGGSRGTVTVDYATVAVNAVPGFDFTPVSGTLTFADGVTTQTIVVPILANPYDAHNELFNVVLSNVTPAAALLGSPSTTLVTIIDTDPNTTPLTVGQATWQGTATTITAIKVTFNQPLAPATAVNPANFLVVGVGPDNRYGTADDYSIGLTPTYDPSTFTVTLTPWEPIVGNTFYHLTLVGTSGGLVNLGGTSLSGDGATAGTDNQSSLARGPASSTTPRPATWSPWASAAAGSSTTFWTARIPASSSCSSTMSRGTPR